MQWSGCTGKEQNPNVVDDFCPVLTSLQRSHVSLAGVAGPRGDLSLLGPAGAEAVGSRAEGRHLHVLILPLSLAKNLHFYLLVNPGAPGGEDLAMAPVLAGTALEEEEEDSSPSACGRVEPSLC